MRVHDYSVAEVNNMKSSLPGRLRRICITKRNVLLPIYEAVVNAIESIMESGQPVLYGSIVIELFRKEQQAVVDEGSILNEVFDVRISDNGIGFTDENMDSFETLDSEHKIKIGGKGVGRLVWLKVFTSVEIESVFAKDGAFYKRTFNFDRDREVSGNSCVLFPEAQASYTKVFLKGCRAQYQIIKSAQAIAEAISEHCLLSKIGQETPNIVVKEGDNAFSVNSIIDDAIIDSRDEKSVLKGESFTVRHLKFNAKRTQPPKLILLGNGRMVDEKPLKDIIPALDGKIKTQKEEYDYSCLVTSQYLDEHIKPDRTGFDLPETNDGSILEAGVISLNEITNGVAESIVGFLSEALEEKRVLTMDRINDFVDKKSPRYKTLLKKLDEYIPLAPNASDNQIDRYLHGKMFEFEQQHLEKGEKLLSDESLSKEEYQKQLDEFIIEARDVKESDLSAYVCHRYKIIALLGKLVQKHDDGKYSYEKEIHSLIMPMKHESGDDEAVDANLWLIDERLAFHNYLASDKRFEEMPPFKDDSKERPDLVATRFYDNPAAVSDRTTAPFTDGITIVEFKRPMVSDVSEETDPMRQSIGYLKRIRNDDVLTKDGRPLKVAKGRCQIYVVCDLTPKMRECCEDNDYKEAPDCESYYKYHSVLDADIEVISFDALIERAKERNYSFFSKLGLKAL